MTIVTRVRSSAEECGSSGVACSAPSDPASNEHDSCDSSSDFNEVLGVSDDDSCVITASLHIGGMFRPAPPPRRRSASAEDEHQRDSAVGSSSPGSVISPLSASTASSPPASPPPAALRVTLTSAPQLRRTNIDQLIELNRERNTSDARAHVLRHHDEPKPRARPEQPTTLVTTRQREQTTMTTRQREETTLTTRHREERTSHRDERRESKEGTLYKRGELISSARPPP
ncbi:uncharacterized protein LOC125489415 [Plutella xylostella]|uniref:uncharacterized protein LOC125489415 n=1 Tax=Plutella xylostella TaxID=51655 RepID=UPI0020329446|nr:uncharacterized protein LOC125489415 [Plutella xylostella]